MHVRLHSCTVNSCERKILAREFRVRLSLQFAITAAHSPGGGGIRREVDGGRGGGGGSLQPPKYRHTVQPYPS